jgi:hypothetical protein
MKMDKEKYLVLTLILGLIVLAASKFISRDMAVLSEEEAGSLFAGQSVTSEPNDITSAL